MIYEIARNQNSSYLKRPNNWLSGKSNGKKEERIISEWEKWYKNHDD